jgi:hypothetical protein
MTQLGRLRSKVLKILDEGNKYCFLVRDAALQRAQCKGLLLVKDEVSVAKEEACLDNEESANELLAFELMLTAQAQELEMWIALKEVRPADAWEHLVNAQDAASNAIRAHKIAEFLETYGQKLDLIERILFPPQVFFSIGGVVRESTCSICNSPYGECDHIKGRPYGGEMCSRIISMAEVREVSIVEDPANKRCRVMEIADNGIRRDYMTWLPIEKSGDEETSV